MRRIYLVEDDPKIRDILADYLHKYDYDVFLVKDFDHITNEFTECEPHLVLLDINLPRFDGFYWCRKIRTISNCPIIFISARDSGMDQVMAIENGADDYITKPFELEVVLAKIKSIMRRVYGEYSSEKDASFIDIEGLQLDTSTFILSYEEKQALLTKKECLLAKALLTQAEKIVSREYLLERLWDDQNFVDDNTLSVNITRLRKKLTDIGIVDALKTIRGAGYKLEKVWER